MSDAEIGLGITVAVLLAGVGAMAIQKVRSPSRTNDPPKDNVTLERLRESLQEERSDIEKMFEKAKEEKRDKQKDVEEIEKRIRADISDKKKELDDVKDNPVRAEEIRRHIKGLHAKLDDLLLKAKRERDDIQKIIREAEVKLEGVERKLKQTRRIRGGRTKKRTHKKGM